MIEINRYNRIANHLTNALLDTNTCIYIIKQKPVSVFQKFSTIAPGQIALSVITLAELEYGARKSASIEKNLSALHQFSVPFDIF